MNIGIRLHDTTGSTLEEHLRSAHEQGFRCAHIALSKTIPGFSMKNAPALMTDALAGEIRSLLEKYEMECAVLGCYLNLATPDEAELANTMECYKAHLRFARAIGATVVGTETGAPNTGYKTCPECFTEESLHLLIDRLRPVVDYAAETGAIIAIEPVCRHIVSTPKRARKVLDAIDSPNLQIILDTVNLLNMGNHTRMEELVEQSFQLFGDRIRILHMKDYQLAEGAADVRSVACGTGLMDYTKLIAFAQAHPGIPMTLENTVPANAVAAREHLLRIANA
ncbi:MAG: sugar phosphate isomerase/epimerase [Clostridiales bacterium]|nr:sugar phosphate isomerase/epimerase [Clostridiales bacterium]